MQLQNSPHPRAAEDRRRRPRRPAASRMLTRRPPARPGAVAVRRRSRGKARPRRPAADDAPASKVMTSRPTVLASVVLALALLGDSLLYAVLPLHAATFGISLAWVGVLLSANRVIRLFVYPFLPRIAATG